MRKIPLAQRLIVGFDFVPPEDPAIAPPDVWAWVEDQILRAADELAGLGIIVKLNSGLRALAYRIIAKLKERGLLAFFDLKLNDIPETLRTDGLLLRQAQPDILTVMCSAEALGMAALKGVLPKTEVIGVTVLTSFTEAMSQRMYRRPIIEAVQMLAEIGKEAGIDGIVSAAKEASMLRKLFGDSMSLNTPAIRPVWSLVEGDGPELRSDHDADQGHRGRRRSACGQPAVLQAGGYPARRRAAHPRRDRQSSPRRRLDAKKTERTFSENKKAPPQSGRSPFLFRHSEPVKSLLSKARNLVADLETLGSLSTLRDNAHYFNFPIFSAISTKRQE